MTGENPFGREPGGDEDEYFEYDLNEGDNDRCVPAGQYRLRVIAITKAESKAGNPMWVFDWSIVKGPHEGFELRDYATLTVSADWKLTNIMQGLRCLPANKKLRFRPSDLVGKECLARIADDEYQGQKKSRIETYLPLDGDEPQTGRSPNMPPRPAVQLSTDTSETKMPPITPGADDGDIPF